MWISVLCTALLGFLVFGLGLVVSLGRGSENKVIGHDEDPSNALHKRVRAHGNTAEYAPMLAVLFLYLGLSDPAVWVLWVIGIVTVCRYAIVVGLLMGSLNKPNPFRLIGALGTYAGGIALSVAAVLTVI